MSTINQEIASKEALEKIEKEESKRLESL